jgi:hypothetical protein
VVLLKKLVLGLAVILMILESGCLTMSVDSKVNKNGEIEKYDLTMKTNAAVYSMLNTMSQEEEGKSLKESMSSQGAEYKEVWDGNNVTMTIKGSIPKNVSVEKNGNFIVYRDKFENLANNKRDNEEDAFGVNKAMDSAIQVHYYLEMPNKIIDSNADYVEGNKAEWHMLNSSSMRDVYAKCEIPSFPLPAVGVFSSLSIILITALVRKSKRDKL